MSNKQIRNTSIVLFLLYVGYYACVSLFVHTHIYDGVVYVHSHPFAKTEKDASPPYQTHNHSGTAFFALNQLSSLTSNQADTLILDEVFRPLLFVTPEYYIEPFDRLDQHPGFHLRAPPSLA